MAVFSALLVGFALPLPISKIGVLQEVASKMFWGFWAEVEVRVKRSLGVGSRNLF
jgi:hypothetical protein